MATIVPALWMILPVALLLSPSSAMAQWSPVKGRIMTRWAEDVTPANAWAEYPRPQMVRERWMNLNGLWDYAIQGKPGEWTGGRIVNADFDPLNRLKDSSPPRWDGKILVPFCVESALSGVGKLVRPGQLLWYRRTFEVPGAWRRERILLHFEAVDWHSIVYVNGERVGENKGGYVPFSLDITDALKDAGPQQIVVVVWDPTNMGDQSVGKQSLPEMRRGFRYTPTTGIWQTVWLEPAPVVSIKRLKVVPDVDNQQARITVTTRGDASGATVRLTASDSAREVASATGAPGEPITLRIPAPKLWSPDSPFLYDLKATLSQDGRALDSVGSYFGMRKIALGKDEKGVTRIFLNNELLWFQFGPLDQGYWPDGVLTPPSDAAAAFDVEYLKDIACNMSRVHVKVHPDRWYYHCDRLGLLVWQDMVCSRKFDKNITGQSASQWESEQRRMIDNLHNHPSIIQWVVFNEGWGQYDTERLTNWTMNYDPSRLVICASGRQDFPGVGHIRDLHDYSFYPSVTLPEVEKDRAIVLGEFGGFNVGTPDHHWHADQVVKPNSDLVREGGRESYADGKAWLSNYERWIGAWRYLIGEHGLSAGVYTQISDVEHELNGWLTYDRAVSKIDTGRLRALHQTLYQTPPAPNSVLLPNSRQHPQTWRYATAGAGADWFSETFNDTAWKTGEGPFGNTGAGEPAVRTHVAENRIYLRRTFNLDRVPERLAIRAYCRGTVDVYFNGRLVKSFTTRRTRDDISVSIVPVAPPAISALREGGNVIAVEARISAGTKFLDVGLIELAE